MAVVKMTAIADSNESSSSNSGSDRDSGDDSDGDEVFPSAAVIDDDNEDESDDESQLRACLQKHVLDCVKLVFLANATPENMMELVYGQGRWKGQPLEAEEDIKGWHMVMSSLRLENPWIINTCDPMPLIPAKSQLVEAFDPAPASRQSRMAIEWGSDGEEIEEDGAKDDEGTHAFYESGTSL